MNIALDLDSPIPLYHQIAEAIRYGIATGRWKAGETLPPVRQASTDWGVHLHTVRRAYQELVRDGLVESLGARGTRVTGRAPDSATTRDLDRTIERWLREAKRRFNLSPDQLADRIRHRDRTAKGAQVYIVECSENQCRDLARQISAVLEVEAKPWSLERGQEPPPGPVIATYFHYNDIRQCWPQRLPDIHFAAIRPDPGLSELIPRGSQRITLEVCEIEPTKAANIAADLSVIFPSSHFRIEPRVVRVPGELLTPKRRNPVLFAPRLWARLDESQRSHPRAFEVTYVWGDGEVRALASRFGWPRVRTLAS